MPAATTSRSELRYRAARKIGDVLVATATAVGTTTTLIDLDHLALQNDYFIGREVIAISGTAANIVSGTGRIRRVSASAKTTGQVTFSRALDAATAVGDVYHMFNYRDNGILIAEWNGFLDEAIDAVRDTFLVPVVSSAITFNRASPVITLSNASLGGSFSDGTLWGVSGVDWKDSNSIWREIKTGDLRVDKPSRTLEIRSRGRENADSQSIRLRGYKQTSLLTADTSTTALDPEYLVNFAAARALFSIARRLGPDSAAAEREATRWLELSERRKVACRTRLVSGTVIL